MIEEGPPARQRATLDLLVGVGVGLGLAIAVGAGVLRFVSTEPPLRRGEWLGDVALAVLVAAPALLALLALRGRVALLTTAGALGMVEAVLSVPISLVLVVPAALYLAAGNRSPVPTLGTGRRVASILIAVVLGIAALWALLSLRADPACYAVVENDGVRTAVEIPQGPFVHQSSISMSSGQLPPGTVESGCTSDTISIPEAVTSLGLVAVMLVLSWYLAPPQAPTLLQNGALTAQGPIS